MNILEKIGEGALMNQIAEECCELAQAALKYRRCLDGENPTPVGLEEAKANMLEEIADVWLCTELFAVSPEDVMKIAETMERKHLRWAERLEGKA